MRIVLVSPSYYPVYGGVTEHVHHLALALHRRGHEVSLVTGGARASHDDDAPFPVHRVGRTIRVPANGGRAAVVLGARIGSRLRGLPLRGADVVHIHQPFEPGLPLEAIRSFAGPIVGTFHTAGRVPRGLRWLLPPLRRRLRRLDLRLAVSTEAMRYAASLSPAAYTIVPNGVDLARFAAVRGQRGARDPLRVLVVGRLEPRKGIDVLLAACARVGADCPPWALDIVGDGPLRPSLERTARRLGLPACFWGEVDPAALPSFYARADIAAAPSTFGESFGVVLLEALAAGLPLVASDLPGYRTVVGEGSALLASPGDPRAFGEALSALLRSASLRGTLGLRASARARQFSWEQIAARVERLYAGLSATAGGPVGPRRRERGQKVASSQAETEISLSRSTPLGVS